MTLLPRQVDPLGASYAVDLAVYQGPLDLLLRLIEREELDITEVNLLAVTDQYLRAIEQLEEIQPGALADFLVVASRLIYLKSRSLLPKPQPPDEEEGEEDPGDALVRQLLEYRSFKQVASALHDREEAGMRAFLRLAPLPEMERKLDLGDLAMDHLFKAVQRALQRIPPEPIVPTVRTYAVTVAEQIEKVRDAVRLSFAGNRAVPVRFSALLSRGQTRMEVIVTFLAVLELIKRRELDVCQETTFGEIVLAPSADAPIPADSTDFETY